jgi:hypothetical protein
MKNLLFEKWMLLVAFLIVGWTAWAQTSTPPSVGAGTKANPYQIETLDNLYWLSQTTAQWGSSKYFIQTADIDATSTSSWDGAKGFKPIGRLASSKRFDANYDGNGKSISNLFINRPLEDGVGLFGYVSQKISNLTLINANITGHNFVGALVGFQNYGNVKKCSSSGIVSGTSYVGGLIGYALQNIEQSYSSANVSVASNLGGGLVGSFEVSGSYYIKNCYATGSVTGNASAQKLGGLIGNATGLSTIQYCYSTGAVSATAGTDLGGLIGSLIDATVNGCYWDTQTSTMAFSAEGTPKTTAEMQTQSTFIDWDFEINWAIIGNNYPSFDFRLPTFGGGAGTVENPYLIASYKHLNQLAQFPEFWGASFSQTSNIDASASATTPYNAIGADPAFTGTYNGNDYTIDGLTTAFASGAGGLFASITAATLSNINLTNAHISSVYMVGGIVGYAEASTITNCSVTGSISAVTVTGGVVGFASSTNINKCSANVVVGGLTMFGETYNTHFGGLVGLVHDYGPPITTISNSFAQGTVSAYNVVGGLVGGVDAESNAFLGVGGAPSNTIGFTMTNCYAANALNVNASGAMAGGVFGQSNYDNSNNAITITNSFWDTDVSVNSTSYIGGIAKSTEQMKTQGTYTGWDFATPIWAIKSTYNNGYPNLDGQSDPVSFTWDGSTNTNWNTAANWTPEGVPAAADIVVIPGTGSGVTNWPVVNEAPATPAVCTDLTIESGGILAIAAGKALTVNGTLTNNAAASGFTIESGGSLITNGTITNNGIINLKRTASDGQYHFVSSPITNATANTFFGEYLQTWDETTATWSNIEDPATELVVAKGYSLWGIAKSDKTYTFTGTPNTGNQSLAITAQGTGGSYNGANMVGNPYPSAINWDILNETYGAVYFWNGSAYVSWNAGGGGSQYVPPMQGFFIVTAANGNFNLTNSSRTHTGATGFYKSGNEKTIENGLILQASNGSYNDELYLLFNDEASPDFELVRDAWKLQSSAAGISQIWSVCSDGNLSIDVRPDQETIQLGFSNDQTGTYNISLNEIAGISKATLEDTKLNIFKDLQNGKYEFAWDKNDAETRFKLHLNTVGIEESPTMPGNLWISGNTLYIAAPNLTGQTGLVDVYNTSGQKLISKTMVLSELSTVELNCKGFTIARLTVGNEVMTVKGVLR